MADESRLTWALIISVLLHGLLLSLLPFLRHAKLAVPKPSFVNVDLVQLPKVPVAPRVAPAPKVPAPPPPKVVMPKQQIVSPPDKGEEVAPAHTRFLSDRNNTVAKEMVHHGQPVAGNPETQHQAREEKETRKAQKQVAKARAVHARSHVEAVPEHARARPQVAGLPKLDQLLPRAGDLIREGLVKPQAAAAPTPQLEASNERTDLLRHGEPWKISGLGGTMDFLPSVQAGDVTMLNTKADQFAPFVRRVAVRVFQNFWILLRRNMDSGLRQSVEESATVEAVMDMHGNLIDLKTKGAQFGGPLNTDRELRKACREAFFDRNPPDGAQASDGKIHFLFHTQVQVMVDPRGGVGGGAMMGAGLL